MRARRLFDVSCRMLFICRKLYNSDRAIEIERERERESDL